jgi:hypothetical protein
MRFFLFCWCVALALTATAQTPSEALLATLRFENNSDTIYKLALLAYPPNDTKNETRVSDMAPHTTKEYSFPIGTQIFLANTEQVSYSMSGNNIQKRGDKPDLIVRKEDDEKTIRLVP